LPAPIDSIPKNGKGGGGGGRRWNYFSRGDVNSLVRLAVMRGKKRRKKKEKKRKKKRKSAKAD